MTQLEPDTLPNPAPRFLKLMLGLPSDASQQEVEAEWLNQVTPIFYAGPQVLFDEIVMNTMAGGLPSQKAYRVVLQTKRGQQLKRSAERETAFRQRLAASVPPFAKPVTKKPKS